MIYGCSNQNFQGFQNPLPNMPLLSLCLLKFSLSKCYFCQQSLMQMFYVQYFVLFFAYRPTHLIAQWLEQLTCIQEVTGLNTDFLIKYQCYLHTHFLKFNFDSTVTWHSKHTSKWDLSKIKRTSSGNSNMLIAILFYYV